MLHVLVTVLSDCNAGAMCLYDVLGVVRPPKLSEFVLFLKSLEVYGSGYLDDIDYLKFNSRQNMNHNESTVVYLQRVTQAYEFVLQALRTVDRNDAMAVLPTY